MATIREVNAVKLFMGKLTYGADLLEEITKVCIDQSICLGRIEALGAVQKARLGYTINKIIGIISLILIKRLRLLI